ncbi:MAG TPA: hypothetical protein VFO25_08505 [Candidatus Eremiobacteraceae bacterium]|nr:hypothetical protein [Candidatus Eremiobacteraceae bacterium]
MLSNEYAPPERVATFRQARYLAGYLDRKGAKSIVVENEYIDRDYLEDFEAYYVRCFERYSSRCRRLHFFSFDLSAADFERRITHLDEASDGVLNSNYLGFVVARPLPEPIVGRTLLKTFDPEGYQRRYRAIREYSVSLFGIDLRLDSLPFQQQDSVVAACATVALWTAFHKAADVFETVAPGPARITNAANAIRPAKRIMPSRELRIDQMCEAVRATGLEPQVERVGSSTPLASIIYGYLEFGLPVALCGYIDGQRGQGHAITVTGYATYSTPDVYSDTTEPVIRGVRSEASRMERLFVHDDNVGPFARMRFEDPGNFPPGLVADTPFVLRGYDLKNIPEHWFVPVLALVPVYGKIRIAYTEIHAWLGLLMDFASLSGVDLSDAIWNVALTKTGILKHDARLKMSDVAGLLGILTAPQPRFIWQATMSRAGRRIVDLLFDATAVSRSNPLFGVIWHDPGLKEELKAKSVERFGAESQKAQNGGAFFETLFK